MAALVGLFCLACSSNDSASDPSDAVTPDTQLPVDTGVEDVATISDTNESDTAIPDTAPAPVCGDGVLDTNEVCDDGNTETESSCSYGTASCEGCNEDCSESLLLTGAYCGDGVQDNNEVCDDGNTETESSCSYGMATCEACNEDCSESLALTGGICGDAVLDFADNETCDDGNIAADDGCSATCTIEPQCTDGCIETEECGADEFCVGKPKSVPGATGQCAPKGGAPGFGQSCGVSTPCPEGLACLGEFVYPDGQGFCIEGWKAKDFYSVDNVVIPEDGTTISSTVVACGLASVPVDVVVTLHLNHPRPEDLVVKLQDPNESQGTVLDQQAYAGGPIVTFVGSGDDQVNGQWTLHVTDKVTGEQGALLGWSVYLLSRFD